MTLSGGGDAVRSGLRLCLSRQTVLGAFPSGRMSVASTSMLSANNTREDARIFSRHASTSTTIRSYRGRAFRYSRQPAQDRGSVERAIVEPPGHTSLSNRLSIYAFPKDTFIASLSTKSTILKGSALGNL